MSRRMAFLHLPPIRWLTSFYNPPSLTKFLKLNLNISAGSFSSLTIATSFSASLLIFTEKLALFLSLVITSSCLTVIVNLFEFSNFLVTSISFLVKINFCATSSGYLAFIYSFDNSLILVVRVNDDLFR